MYSSKSKLALLKNTNVVPDLSLNALTKDL